MQPDDDKTQAVTVLSKGTVVGHYRIVEKIGAGGMGEVYLAEDEQLSRQVALKFLGTHLAASADCRERFQHEAQAAAKLNHPNIVTIYEVGEHQRRPYIAMEYIRGQSLKEILAQGPLPPERTIEIACQICHGLTTAHEGGIIHRDIKPANIIIDDKGRVRLLDFGLAKAQDSDLPSQSETTAGTINYMAPELLTGGSITPASDIFSLGVVLYQMLTGKLPFTGEYEATIIYAIVNIEPEPLSKHLGEVPPRLQGIIDRALGKDRLERYQQMTELLVDLKQATVRTDSPGAETRPEPTREASVAVLPFVDMSPEKDQEYFCDGIAEELINALTRAGGLRVAARTSAFQYKGQSQDIRQIGKMLNVDHILEGSVRKAGNRIRITAELVNVADGYHLWAESFDRNIEDVFAIQDEISQAISGSLKVRLAGDKRRPLVAKPTEILEAYNLYLKGRYFWNKRYQGGLQKGMEYFKQVIDLDPGYARAYAGLSDSYNILAFYNHLPPLEACPKAKAAAMKALEIDPDLAEAHTSLGWVHNFYDRDWVSAEKEFKQSLELNPNYAITCHYYGLFLVAMKRFDEGIAMMKKARDLDPLSLIIGASLGGTLYFARRFDEAIPPLLQAIEIDPDFALAHSWIAGAYVEKGLLEQATAECRKAESLARGGTYATSWLGFSLGVSGQSAEAREIAQRLIDQSEKHYVSSYHIALVFAGLGDGAATMHWLEKAFNERDNWLVWLGVHPAFDSVRNLPEFGELLRRVGL
ncbi:MAG: protein kinase [candidate division Zixibacteria bacterium]|nr:protein kinase [candidate division Zixibacteria bacterium]